MKILLFVLALPLAAQTLAPSTVANLPPASTWANRSGVVTDGANAMDCTTGKGTSTVVCISNGVTWLPSGLGALTGTGSVVLGTNPTITLANATGLPGTGAVSTSVTGNQVMQVCHATYSFAVDGGGAPGLITPAANCTIPANSIIFNEILDWTTAGVGASNTTSIGTTGTGGGAAILLGATAVGSLTGIVQGVIVPQTASGFKKITTAGTVTLTTAVAALTAGICEIYVLYITSPS